MHRVLAWMIIAAATIFSLQQLVQFYQAGAASQSGLAVTVSGVVISLSGAAFATVVIFEALFYPLGRVRYVAGDRLGATLAFLMLFVAIGYTFTADFETNVTGRADKVAERGAVSENRETIKKEIADLRAQREAWKARLETAGSVTLKELNQRITEANERIDALQRKMAVAQANAGGAPASQFLAEHIGRDEAFWATILLCFKLLFPACMRAFAWEFAISSADLIRPKQREPRAIDLTPLQTVPALAAPQALEADKPAQISPPKAPEADIQAVSKDDGVGKNPLSQDKHEDGIQAAPEEDRRKFKKQERKSRKALGNVLPFAKGSGARKPRSLTDVVAAFSHGMEGEHPFAKLYPSIKAAAGRARIPVSKPLAGKALQALGHEQFKRGNVVHYRFGGASVDAEIA